MIGNVPFKTIPTPKWPYFPIFYIISPQIWLFSPHQMFFFIKCYFYIFDLCSVGMNVIFLTFQTSIVPNILRFGTFCVWTISNHFEHFWPFNFTLTVNKRLETLGTQTDPNSERYETPRNKKWETFRKQSFFYGKWF